MNGATSPDPLSTFALVKGPPLDEEPGLGALTLPGFLREVTRLHHDREALVLRDGTDITRWTYGELWERTVEVARALRACGMGQGSRVGILMTNRPEWLAAVFGTSLVGGVAAAFSTFSTPSELEFLIQTSGVSILVFERNVLAVDFAKTLRELEPAIGEARPGALESGRFPHLRRLVALGDGAAGGAIESWSDFLERGSTEPRALVEATAAAVRPSDPALLFFSSGSTARPKGVLSSHRAVSIQLWRFPRLYDFKPEDRIRSWVANGFFWSGNVGMAIGTTLGSGGCLILQRTFDAAGALELMDAEHVNFPFAWPHQWAQLEEAPNWKDVDLSSIRFADAEISPFPRHPTFDAPVWHEPNRSYGNTETFTLTTAYPANTPPEEHAGSHGQVLPGVTVKIIDPRSGEIVRRGERGEICVKGPTLMIGYIGTPLDESLDAEGFFATGDGGYLDDAGRLFWEGRLSDVIKTGGANVSPFEIDEVLGEYPGVKLARTVGVPHDTLGEIVVACVVPQDGARLDPQAIRASLRERLAAYKVPRHVLFLREEEIALTGTAKIKSSDLREWAAKRLGNVQRDE